MTWRIAVLLAAAGWLAVGGAKAAPLRPIALTGTDGALGPNLGSGVTFSSFLNHRPGGSVLFGPSLAGTGAVVFSGELAGTGVGAGNNLGIWASRGGSALSVVAREGDAVAGLAQGIALADVASMPQITDTGVVVFQGAVSGGDAWAFTNDCMFVETTGRISPLIREGTTVVPPPADPPVVFADPNGGVNYWGANNGWVANAAGAVALRTFVGEAGGMFNAHFGVYTDRDGPLDKHYRGGDAWSDGASSTVFFGCSNPRMNDSGAMVTSRLDTAFGAGVWSDRALAPGGAGAPGRGALRPVALRGQSAPSTASTYHSFAAAWINAAGRVAFHTQFAPGGPGVGGGLFSDARFGVLQPVILSGGAAAGTTATFVNDASFLLDAALADNNCIVALCQLQHSGSVGSGNDSGLWSTRSVTTGLPGNVRLVVREGSPVPGGAGPDFDGLAFGELLTFWVNASGRVAFLTRHNDFTRALWIENADGSLSPVVKEFTLLDVRGDGADLRLVSEIGVIGSSGSTGDGRATPFNDAGDIAVQLIFVDGSEGVFTTAPAPACTPAAAGAVSGGGTIQPGDQATLTAAFTGSGPIAKRWLRNGEPIIDGPGGASPGGGVVSGSLTGTLHITGAVGGDGGAYTCIGVNACGEATTAGVTLNVGAPSQRCQPADIASDDGTPLPTDTALHPNGGVNEGDYNSFFQGFFDAAANCDIANDDATPRAPFGANTVNGGVNEGDYNCFFQRFFDGCPA